MQNILVLDNYDSFTYNLVHILRDLEIEVVVKRNDQISLPMVGEFEKIIPSPGPGTPQHAGIMLEVIQTYHNSRSILGVCLGHQGLAVAFGGSIKQMRRVMHGQQTTIAVDRSCHLFTDLPGRIDVGHYHSWIVDDVPENFRITATDHYQRVMAISHNEYDVHGVQFHPESIMTGFGKQIITNWVKGVNNESVA